jgi:hypothetical protein
LSHLGLDQRVRSSTAILFYKIESSFGEKKGFVDLIKEKAFELCTNYVE